MQIIACLFKGWWCCKVEFIEVHVHQYLVNLVAQRATISLVYINDWGVKVAFSFSIQGEINVLVDGPRTSTVSVAHATISQRCHPCTETSKGGYGFLSPSVLELNAGCTLKQPKI